MYIVIFVDVFHKMNKLFVLNLPVQVVNEMYVVLLLQFLKGELHFYFLQYHQVDRLEKQVPFDL